MYFMCPLITFTKHNEVCSAYPIDYCYYINTIQSAKLTATVKVYSCLTKVYVMAALLFCRIGLQTGTIPTDLAAIGYCLHADLLHKLSRT